MGYFGFNIKKTFVVPVYNIRHPPATAPGFSDLSNLLLCPYVNEKGSKESVSFIDSMFYSPYETNMESRLQKLKKM